MYNNAYNVYKTNSVNYSSKDQLLLMLVDGAAKFAKIARQAIIDNDIKKSHENLVKTQDIFIELMATLDVSAGDWAQNLFQVYGFINENLVKANLKKDVEILDSVIPIIDDVKDTWHEAYKLSKGAR